MDSRAVELALNRTERGLQVACERVENSGTNNVVTLPAVKRDSAVSEASPHGARSQRSKSMKELVSVARKRSPIKQTARKQQVPGAVPNSLSPGQQLQAQHITHLISQPTHPMTQQILSSHYGLPPPSAVMAGGKKEGKGQVVTGPTTNHLATLPRANRRDAQVLINPLHKRSRVTVVCLLCVCVCVSVPALTARVLILAVQAWY